jgi:hypothetical protein
MVHYAFAKFTYYRQCTKKASDQNKEAVKAFGKICFTFFLLLKAMLHFTLCTNVDMQAMSALMAGHYSRCCQHIVCKFCRESLKNGYAYDGKSPGDWVYMFSSSMRNLI